MGSPHTKVLSPTVNDDDVIALSGGAATLNLTVTDQLAARYIAGVSFYSDAAGATPALPTAGTVTYTVKTPVLPNDFQPFLDNVVDLAVKQEQVNWATNTNEVQAILASIAGGGATHCRLRVGVNGV